MNARDRIARAHRAAAHYAAISGGRVGLQTFARLEREKAAMDATDSMLDRARRAAGL